MGRYFCQLPQWSDYARDCSKICAATSQQRAGEGNWGTDAAIWRIFMGPDRAMEEESGKPRESEVIVISSDEDNNDLLRSIEVEAHPRVFQ